MKTIEFQVENIKCGGCANSIKSSLSKIEGVDQINVDIENGVISTTAEDFVDEVELRKVLHTMGYTAPGEGGTIDKAKSYVSCMIGRIKS